MNAINPFTAHNLDAVRATVVVIVDNLLPTIDSRGHIERLPGLPGAKGPEEEVMPVGFPF